MITWQNLDAGYSLLDSFFTTHYNPISEILAANSHVVFFMDVVKNGLLITTFVAEATVILLGIIVVLAFFYNLTGPLIKRFSNW